MAIVTAKYLGLCGQISSFGRQRLYTLFHAEVGPEIVELWEWIQMTLRPLKQLEIQGYNFGEFF